jgi:hypothetical protein
MRRFIASGCWTDCLILPRRDAAGRGRRVGQIASTVGLEGRVGAAGSADASDVGLALRKAVKAAIGAASGVASTPGSIGARMCAGDGQCRQSSRDDDDSPHGNLLGDEHPPCAGLVTAPAVAVQKACPRHAPADSGRPARSYSAVSPKKLSRAEALLRKTQIHHLMLSYASDFCYRPRRLRLCAGFVLPRLGPRGHRRSGSPRPLTSQLQR